MKMKRSFFVQVHLVHAGSATGSVGGHAGEQGPLYLFHLYPDIPNGVNGTSMSSHLWKERPILLCQLSPNIGCLESFWMPDFGSKVTSVVFKLTLPVI